MYIRIEAIVARYRDRLRWCNALYVSFLHTAWGSADVPTEKFYREHTYIYSQFIPIFISYYRTFLKYV